MRPIAIDCLLEAVTMGDLRRISREEFLEFLDRMGVEAYRTPLCPSIIEQAELKAQWERDMDRECESVG